MKAGFALILSTILALSASATTIMVVPIFEPISLHGTDGDEVVSEVGEALQASVMSRPMALTGAFPEMLVDAIRSPHLLRSNSPNYKVREVNLLVLANVGIGAELHEGTLTVRLSIGDMAVPADVDLTPRQILNLAIVALKKTLEDYQRHQTKPLPVNLVIEGAEGPNASLKDLEAKFEIAGQPAD